MADAVPFPDLPGELAIDAGALHRAHRRSTARKRVRASMPPIPEMRFEQAYLRSIMPALFARKAHAGADVKTDIAAGREVAVTWSSVAWITLRDQVISPFLQGAFWGLLSLSAGTITAALRGSWGASGKNRLDRVAGGGDDHSFRKSGAGAAEANLALH